mmetsp:Transcript_7564/g.5973  ORF Transcript_7564/g.5973 Transcript_7564/m.5973 type:complete len:90 (+) Transcript_7564:1-270(+)
MSPPRTNGTVSCSDSCSDSSGSCSTSCPLGAAQHNHIGMLRQTPTPCHVCAQKIHTRLHALTEGRCFERATPEPKWLEPKWLRNGMTVS